MVKRLWFVIAVMTASASSIAQAQIDNAGVLDQALLRFRQSAQSWQSASLGAATSLFWTLAAISLVWTMGQLALRRAELGEFFGEFARYMLFTGFWAWMLQNGPAHAQLIMDSMVQLGGSASSLTLKSPSGVLDIGFHLLDRALAQSSLQSPIETSIGVLMALGVLVVLALVGVNMLVTMIACWIVAYGGLVVLGFGGSKWTSDMAMNYYRMILSLGLQVLAMVLLVGIGEGLLRDYFGRLEPTVNVRELAVMLVIAIVLFVVVSKVPSLLGTLANGSSPQYAMGSGFGFGDAWRTGRAAKGLAEWTGGKAVDSAKLAFAATRGSVGLGIAATAALADAFRGDSSSRPAISGSVFAAPESGGDDSRTLAQPTARAEIEPSGGGPDAGASRQEQPQPSTSAPSANSDETSSAGVIRDEQAPRSLRSADAAAERADTAGAGRAGDDSSTADAQSEPDSDSTPPVSRDEVLAVSGAAPGSTRSSSDDASGGTHGDDSETRTNLGESQAGDWASSTHGAAPLHSESNNSESAIDRATSQSTQSAPRAELSSDATAPPAGLVPPPPAGVLASAGAPTATTSLQGARLDELAAPPPLGAFQPAAAPQRQPITQAPSKPTHERSGSDELHAATAAQRSVDIEAEVAAFRDHED